MPEEQKQEVKPPTPDPKRGLIVKLCEVMASVGYMQKRGANTSQGYKYLKEADIADAMREEFAKRNVFIFPNLVKNERVKVVRSKTFRDVIEEKVTYATDVEIDWTFVDGDTGQEKTCRIPGCSESPGDKGVYVAMTGSEKYLLMKSFLIPTGDDPEDDKNETDGKGSREAEQDVARKQLEEKAKSPNPKVAKLAQEGLAKMDEKSRPGASNSVPSLFYALQPSGMYAIDGDDNLKRACWKTLKPFWSENAKCFMVTDNQLEDLKYHFEQAHISFAPLKGPEEK